MIPVPTHDCQGRPSVDFNIESITRSATSTMRPPRIGDPTEEPPPCSHLHLTQIVQVAGRRSSLRRHQSSQMRSPHRHSNMWIIWPLCTFMTVRTSSSFSPHKRQRLIEELSISATFCARYNSTAHSPSQVRHAIGKMNTVIWKNILSQRKHPRGALLS
jgi:hypothetical protein